MARKVSRSTTPASAPQGADAADASELDTLFPERAVTIAGEPITVREISFGDGLRLHMHVAPLVAAIEETMRARNEAPSWTDMIAVFGRHWESTLELVAVSSGKDIAWLRGLRGADGDVLLMTFWTINASFFIQRAMNELLIRQEQARLAGESSSPPSSRTDTGTRTSGGTPGGS